MKPFIISCCIIYHILQKYLMILFVLLDTLDLVPIELNTFKFFTKYRERKNKIYFQEVLNNSFFIISYIRSNFFRT